MKRLTIGFRARIKPGTSWDKDWEYGNREVLLVERSSGGDFSVMILKEGVNVPLLRENDCPVRNEVAWVDEDDRELVDKDLDTNMDFIDWYQEHRDDFCGDCGVWFPNNGAIDPATDEEHVCPSEDCSGRLYDSGICPYCRTPAPEEGDQCPECGFNWQLRF